MGNNHSKRPAGLLLLLVLFSWLTACKKDNPDPTKKEPCPWPEITTEGKHTLGFKINGKEWVPCVDFYGAAVTLRPIDATMTDSDGSNALSIVGHYSRWSDGDSTNNTYGFWFRPLHLGVIATHELMDCNFNFNQSDQGVFENKWSLPESREGFYLEILKLDTANNIVSGIFEAVMIPQNGTDTLYITEGRFDVTYYPQ